MSICPSCQAVNPDSYQFCQFCGTKIAIVPPVSTPVSIIEEEVIQPSTVTTKQLNLDILEDTEIQVEEFASSQLLDNLDDTDDIKNYLTDFPTDFPEELSADLLVTIPVLPDSPNPPITLESSINPLSTNYSSISLQNIDINYAGKTDVGIQRDRNEDDFAVIFQTRSIEGKSQISDRSQRGLFVLCDGMGGHEGGEVASAIAVNTITEQFRPFWIDTLPGEKKLSEVISNANQAIFDQNESEQRQSLGRMGTTLVMLAIHDLDVAIAHVGDSRIYKVTDKLEPKLEQITRDHEVLNQLLDLGVEFDNAIARPDAHQLTQALGPNPSDRLEPAINFFRLTESSLFLLCSDGLCDNDVVENYWRSHLLPILNQEIDLQTGLDQLIDLGNRLNGHDNLTAVIVLCHLEHSESASELPLSDDFIALEPE